MEGARRAPQGGQGRAGSSSLSKDVNIPTSSMHENRPRTHTDTQPPTTSLSHHGHFLLLCYPQVAGRSCMTSVFCNLKQGSHKGGVGSDDLAVWKSGAGLGCCPPYIHVHTHTRVLTHTSPLTTHWGSHGKQWFSNLAEDGYQLRS